ncbi:iron-containing alcohol dehydrogenase family protein [Variovorax sp. KK3]|uniref:iron-containing alcohol dehydrogenase family protein n=1 Tax=Variovorax sp. KK3 TaxID=1855728 RepID=UPI0009F9819F|nr:iron-containing alcohol dehydrogenase [Variovorax sp. KK3]
MMSPSFDYAGFASRVLSGPGTIDRIADEVRRLDAKRVLLITGRRTGQTQLVARIRTVLGELLVETFDGVTEHSSVAIVEQLARRVREIDADLLLAVGGGSASDTAKGVAILLAEGPPLARHANTFTPPDKLVQQELLQPKMPIIAVPTTASAAEVTPGLGIRDEHGHKLLLWDAKAMPRTIILDPQANLEVPLAIMTTSGMNALAHCIEGLYSKRANPISDALALHGIRLLAQGLRAMVGDPDSIDARADVLNGAHLSGMVIPNTRTCIHHGVCHCLGALGGLPHGVANAILLPHAMHFNREAAASKLALAAEAFGVDVRGMDEAAAVDASVEAVRQLQRDLGVPTRLRDTPLDRALLPAIADHAMGDRALYFNPGPTPTPQAVLSLLEAAW